MEGGGNTASTRAALRQGMGEFLSAIKKVAQSKSYRWKIVACGGRDHAYDVFSNRPDPDYPIRVLLVDAEGPVTDTACAHLTVQDGWDLQRFDDTVVHLMAQVMETWIVADPEALSAYYRQGFNASYLPRRSNLEEAPKSSVVTALGRATQNTQKGAYHKIRHASDLLKLIDTNKVKQRCPNCARMFTDLGQVIASYS